MSKENINHSTPVNEAKEVESLQEFAKNEAQLRYPINETTQDLYSASNRAFQHGVLAGYKYLAANPIENKEGVKSEGEQKLFDCQSALTIAKNAAKHRSERIKELEAQLAQFTPIEQGKRMVSVEEVEKLLDGYVWDGKLLASDLSAIIKELQP